jgi:energy-coupling factor transporter ATP-binding protein EcfA2
MQAKPNSQNYGVTLIIGNTGCGKTTLMNNVLPGYKSNVIYYSGKINNNLKLPFVNSIDKIKNGKFKLDRRVIKYKDFVNFCLGLQNTILVFDDCRIFEKDRISEQLADLLICAREYRVEVILIFQSFSYTPKEIFSYANRIYCFKTTEDIDIVSKIPDKAKIIPAVNYLQNQPPHTMLRIDMRE